MRILPDGKDSFVFQWMNEHMALCGKKTIGIATWAKTKNILHLIIIIQLILDY